jgi:hypothetical protein
VGDREADLFVTTAGTPADLQAGCAFAHKGDRPAFRACLNNGPATAISAPDATFVLKASRKPSPKARLVYRVVDRGSTTPVTVRKIADGVEVSYYGAERIAKQIFVGWRPVKKAARLVHLRVRLRELLVRRAMDPGCSVDPNCPDRDESTLPGQITSAPGEWNVYVDAGGIWAPWNPILLHPHDGDRIKSKQTIELYAPTGKPWRLFVQTRECDYGTLGNAYSVAGTVSPCPHTGEIGNEVSDDQPGKIAVHFRSPAASLGTHQVNPNTGGSSCPADPNVHGCYRLTFTISRIRP